MLIISRSGASWIVGRARFPVGVPLRTLPLCPIMVDMQVIVRRQDQKPCASITCMIRHYVAPKGEGDLRSPT